MTDRERAKRIIVEIVRQSGGELCGRTKLFKAFYLAHLFYDERTNRTLSAWPIVKMPNGPGIEEGWQLTRELEAAGILECTTVKVGPYDSPSFRLLRQQPGEHLTDDAIEAIRTAVEFVQGKTASELSELMHEFSRSWNLEEKEGKPLNIYIDSLDDADYDTLTLNQAKIEAALNGVFSG